MVKKSKVVFSNPAIDDYRAFTTQRLAELSAGWKKRQREKLKPISCISTITCLKTLQASLTIFPGRLSLINNP